MDYTKLPRYFIYKDRKDIDEYDVKTITPQYQRVLASIGEKAIDGFKTMDQRMFEAVESSAIVRLDGARQYVCDIFNTAHYITTLILMDQHPMLNFRTYLDRADEVAAEHGRKDPNHIPLQGMTMALVYNYLIKLKPRFLNMIDFAENLENHFSSRFTTSESISYSMAGKMDHSVAQAILAEQLFDRNMLTSKECDSLKIEIKDFLPRPIDEVLPESNYADIYEHLDYIEECMKKLPPEKLLDAPKLAAQVIWRTAHEALQGAMPEAAKDVRRMVSIALDRLGVPDFPEQLALELEGIDETEEKPVPESAEDSSEKDRTIQELQARLKEMEENLPLEEEWDYIGETPIRETFSRADMERALAEYKGQIESLKKEKESQDRQIQELLAKLNDDKTKYQDLENKFGELQKQASTSQGFTTVEEMTIELFTYLLDSKETAEAFYHDVYGKADPDIAEIVASYKDKFAQRVRNCDIYRPLHAAKLYHGTDRNFDTALRNLKFRE